MAGRYAQNNSGVGFLFSLGEKTFLLKNNFDTEGTD
jgi:hypothetical protein